MDSNAVPQKLRNPAPVPSTPGFDSPSLVCNAMMAMKAECFDHAMPGLQLPS